MTIILFYCLIGIIVAYVLAFQVEYPASSVHHTYKYKVSSAGTWIAVDCTTCGKYGDFKDML